MKTARATRDAPSESFEQRRADDGVARAAGVLAPINQLVPVALATTFQRPEIVKPILLDEDTFDDDDCSLYSVAAYDDDPTFLMQVELNKGCQRCGGTIFCRGRCLQCGGADPSKRMECMR